MRICSWNINSVRARLGLVERYLKERSPDVLLLQETKAKDSEFPLETFAALGYQTVRAGQPSYNGVAIVSRLPIVEPRVGLRAGDDPTERRVIRAQIVPEQGPPLRVCSVYVPNGKSLDSPAYGVKLAFLEELRHTLRDDGDLESLVVGGDFNVAHDGRDVFDEAAMSGQLHFTTAERAQLDQLLELGLFDSLRQLHAEPKLFSWWDYRMMAFRRNRGLRIDYLFVGERVRANLRGAAIEREPRAWPQPSDHTPVSVDFEWPS